MTDEKNLNSIEVLVLCGGKGTRLSSVVSDVPKPMAPIGEKPFLDFIVQEASNSGFKNFCFLTGYKEEIIRSHYTSELFPELNIRFSNEDSPLGTGGALKKAISSSSYSKFLVINGDTYFDLDLNEMIEAQEGSVASVALRLMNNPDRYGLVDFDSESSITHFREKEAGHLQGYINAGVYFLDKSIETLIQDGFVSLETEVFPKLIEENKLTAHPTAGRFIDIGIPEDYDKAQSLLPKWSKETPGFIVFTGASFQSEISSPIMGVALFPTLDNVNLMPDSILSQLNEVKSTSTRTYILEITHSVNEKVVSLHTFRIRGKKLIKMRKFSQKMTDYDHLKEWLEELSKQ